MSFRPPDSDNRSENGWLASFSNRVIEQFSEKNSENRVITRFENEASQPPSEPLSDRFVAENPVNIKALPPHFE